MGNLLYAAFGADPLATFVVILLAVSVTGAAAVLVVAGVRPAARRVFGPIGAYPLWGAPLLAMAVTALIILIPTQAESVSPAAAVAARLPALAFAAPVWALGAAVLATVFAVAQARFMADVRTGRAGPAVVGFISPRVVLPADDGHYTPQERELIRAHERAHVARKDPRAAALVAALQCLFWFNPLAHLAAYLIRLDQELACDALVVMRRPEARSLYARTLLKTQLAATPLPFGCYWSPHGRHPLEVRIALLKRRTAKPAARPAAGGLVVQASMDAIRP